MKNDRPSTEKPAATNGMVPEASSLAQETSANVELHIEELVLRGFAHRDRFLIGDGLEREFTRLISQLGLRTHASESIDRLDGGTIEVAPGATARAVGAQIAQEVYRHFSMANRPLSGKRFESNCREGK